eukprot:TRINITY_DN25400_c0_g1_i1.p2 TRINITY_DN25400_c0_g1~~TRINITY_DN25400_c0_g1_i1.p2  ORF type:complete len:418 (-),score=121.82 TRINITY_DN25400_c0_g1_i1:5-1258(-)
MKIQNLKGFSSKAFLVFFFQAEDGIRDVERSRGLGDVYKRQYQRRVHGYMFACQGPDPIRKAFQYHCPLVVLPSFLFTLPCPFGKRSVREEILLFRRQEEKIMTRKDRTEGIYSRREVLDESERNQYNLIQLKELLTYAYRYSEDVKKRFDRAQFQAEKFKSLSDIKHIPILKKKELIFLQSMGPRLGGLLTKDLGELRRIFLSPGPIFDPEDRTEDYWGWTEGFYAAGYRSGDVAQITFNYHLTPAGLMFEEPLRNLGCAVVPAGPGNTSSQLEIMQKLRATGYVGTPSYLMHLAQKAEEQGLNLRKDLYLEVAFVTGEKFSEKMRATVEKKFDLIMRQGYGTADVGCIGYECFHKTGLHISNRAFVEICHPDTGIPLKDGEVGEIVVTAFNKTYPLIRLATGDLSYIDRAPCTLR